MKIWYLYLKSHCEFPDFESEIETKSKKEAIKYFLKQLNFSTGDWDESMIKDEVMCGDCLDKNEQACLHK